MFNNNWDNILQEEVKKDYFKQLIKRIKDEYLNSKVYPKYEDIYNALKLTNYNNVKVVILGQDPYHNNGQAHGLAFSVTKECKIPKSLNNIYTELVNDVGISFPQHGNLENWAKQGVLLLNTILTVRENEPTSHSNIGWELFTDKIITLLNDKKTPQVFILWGKEAQKKEYLINNQIHLILKSAHPSPLSAHKGFFGCKHFSKTNEFLSKFSNETINWQI